VGPKSYACINFMPRDCRTQCSSIVMLEQIQWHVFLGEYDALNKYAVQMVLSSGNRNMHHSSNLLEYHKIQITYIYDSLHLQFILSIYIYVIQYFFINSNPDHHPTHVVNLILIDFFCPQV
jgi:hypothetical protein